MEFQKSNCISSDAGKQKLAAWTTGQPHRLAVDAGVAAADVSAVDGQGRALVIKEEGGRLALDLQTAPEYLTLKKRSPKLAAVGVPTTPNAVKELDGFVHFGHGQPTGIDGGLQAAALSDAEGARVRQRFQIDALGARMKAVYDKYHPRR